MTLEIRGVSKTFNDMLVLNDVELVFEPNKIYGLFGPNDSGKTTLLRMIANLCYPSEGYIEVDGKDLAEFPAMVEKIYFQSHDKIFAREVPLKKIIKDMTTFYSTFHPKVCHQLMAKYDISEKLHFYQLSLREKVLFRNCLSMSLDVDYLLLDEPGFSLDPTYRHHFYKDMEASMERYPKTIILSTHTIDEVQDIIDDVIILESGQVLVANDVKDVVEQAFAIEGNERDIREFLHGKDILLGQEYDNGIIRAYVQASVSDFVGYDNLKVEQLDLQDLFIQLTRNAYREEVSVSDQ